MQSPSKKFKFFVGLIFLGGFTLLLEEAVWKTGTKVWLKLDSGTTCQIPKIDPFLKSTKFLIELASNLGGSPACIGKEILFKVDHNSKLIRTGGNDKFWEDFDCCYSLFHQSSVPKISILHKQLVNGEVCYPLRQDATQIPEGHTNLDIKCRSKSTQEITYRYQLQNQHLKPKQEIDNVTINPSEKLSILILGLDSVSHANFLRYMGKTYEFLIQNLSAIEYHGLNKIGRGTDDNLVALLSGCKLEHPKRVDPNCELIWTEFSDQGYTTLHSEDHPHNAKHTYPVIRRNRPGIGVDYDNSEYMAGAHYIHGLSPENNMLDKYGCFGDQFVYDVFVDEILKTARALQNSPYFNFVWTTTVAHEVLRNAKYMDEPTYELLVRMKTENLLNNTVLVLLSDHGLSFGEYSKTSIGTVEALMPLLYFVFPNWFKDKYRTAITNLELNSERLSTPYDIYETLKDILNLTRLDVDDTKADIRLGQSLFNPLPLNRTCEMANIPPEYCICWERTVLPNPGNNSIIVQGTSFAVGWLNNELNLFPMCERLKPSSIISADLLITRVESDTETNYEIVFVTLPNQAEFRALLSFKSNNFEVIGEVTRVNAYKNQSACISDWANATYVKSICYCKY